MGKGNTLSLALTIIGAGLLLVLFIWSFVGIYQSQMTIFVSLTIVGLLLTFIGNRMRDRNDFDYR